jgi:pSer/pThr/pTyr-binding forkhead associated (FHA) protein
MDPFFEICGVRSLHVAVAREGVESGAFHHISDRPYLLIGRDPRSDLRLEDDGVSKRHAYVQAVGGRLFCVDLGSRTGVHWPAGPQSSGWVEWGEPLRLGSVVVRITRSQRTEGVDAYPSEEDLTRACAPMKVQCEVSDGAARPVLWGMKRLLALVGGSAGCKVRLRDPSVSRFHCGLVRGPLGVCVIDLMSRSGTRVNGEKIAWAKLEDGDRLQVGPYVLQVRYGSSAAVQPTALAPAGRVLATPSRSFPAPAVMDRSLLLPVINEFSLMQQQMFDQFHQTMLMMAELFTALHKEQAGLVREELEHLRRLTRELNALRSEQAMQAARGSAAPALANGLDVAQPTDKRLSEATEGASILASELAQPKDAATEGAAVQAAAVSKKAAPAAPDVHDWLTRRIDALQVERQGRWQKLMSIVMGR